ncbi:hypothetical protein CAter282_1383 [Collimonas arenae]|uniref:Uncharacterized protein n=1 Tax=Collimonas arenae TaxID=279058 RepID=A0A127QHU3_9BURK|nr:hypothetical protein CAter10_1487 [Collimonas arenae]AMP09172.1 hypothetical protein CAter282_1383 [Collimonas arenae]
MCIHGSRHDQQCDCRRYWCQISIHLPFSPSIAASTSKAGHFFIYFSTLRFQAPQRENLFSIQSPIQQDQPNKTPPGMSQRIKALSADLSPKINRKNNVRSCPAHHSNPPQPPSAQAQIFHLETLRWGHSRDRKSGCQ